MQIKKKISLTSGTRHQININKKVLSKFNTISKELLLRIKKFGGRNNTGRITVRHKGGGQKKISHLINTLKHYSGVVINIMYDSTRNSFVSLNFDFRTNTFFKSIAIKKVLPGCLIKSDSKIDNIKLGYRSLLNKLPLGILINSISKNKKIKYSKSAGSFSQIIERKNNNIKIRLASGNKITLLLSEYASLGVITNSENKLLKIGKAGRNRLKGIRPSVRGIAMNPVDHPHGGKSNKGMPQVTPWGVPTKNKRTVIKKKYE